MITTPLAPALVAGIRAAFPGTLVLAGDYDGDKAAAALSEGRADLVAFAPDASFTVDPAALHHRNPVTPYAGQTLTGVVRATWLRGRAVTGDTPHGRFLTREP